MTSVETWAFPDGSCEVFQDGSEFVAVHTDGRVMRRDSMKLITLAIEAHWETFD